MEFLILFIVMFALFMLFRNEQVYKFKTKINGFLSHFHRELINNNVIRNSSEFAENYKIVNDYHFYFFRFWIDLDEEFEKFQLVLRDKYFIKTEVENE